MSDPIVPVGETIIARCTKCKSATRHIIVSLLEGKPSKVQCTVCQGVHNFYPLAPSKGPTAPRAEKKAAQPSAAKLSKAASAILLEWEELLAKKNPDQARPYDMVGSFKTGELITHPTFGLGVVRKVLAPNKMQVLFRDALKQLICKA